MSWTEVVDRVAALDRAGFRAVLEDYKRDRAAGDREHRRRTDVAAGAISPQKLYGVPVALMFFEGVVRLRQSGVAIPGLVEGDPGRIVVEAYPGVVARDLIGRRRYKSDSAGAQTRESFEARCELLSALCGPVGRRRFGLETHVETQVVEDPCGDRIDALVCAVQAAWASMRRASGFGRGSAYDMLEGWIADPVASASTSFE